MINTYPTWIIKGRRYKGLLTTKRLVALSGYTGPVNQETGK